MGVQVGLELTHIAGPLGSAISRLCNLTLVDALQRSGSNIFAEEKIASLIGQWRVNSDTMKLFKDSVAPSKSFDLSKYVDIALHAGAGPTVQAALRDQNPGYASMVLHLSLLSFACEDESLAHAMTTAFEKYLETTRSGLEKAPDYLSLLGTIRACRQQTTEFSWNHYFDDVASRLKANFDSQEIHALRGNKRRRLGVTDSLLSSCIEQRCIPYTTMAALIMWVAKLQNLPEEYRLHLKCSTGLTTIIVWCYYVLDISCTVWTSSQNICKFGSGESLITLEAVPTSEEHAMVLEAKEPHESLFNLLPTVLDPPIETESRTAALGFARKALKIRLDDASIDHFAGWCIAKCCESFSKDLESMRYSYGNLEWTKLTEEKIQQAGIFLFSLNKLPAEFALYSKNRIQELSPINITDLGNIPEAFLDLIHAFARVIDLDECTSLPLSLIAFEEREPENAETPTKNQTLSLYDSFEYVSTLLLGREDRKDYQADVVLRSAWGWSVYFPCFMPADPCQLDTTHLVIRPGVPTRTHTGDRKTRIMDLTSRGKITSPTVKGTIIDSHDGLTYFPGISTAERSHVLVGNQDESTFSIVQIFRWKSINSKEFREYRLGFRQMLHLRQAFVLVPRCNGDCRISKRSAQKDENLLTFSRSVRGVQDTTPDVIRTRFGFQERVFGLATGEAGEAFRQDTSSSNLWFLYITRGEAARWLQMCDFLTINPYELSKKASYILVHQKCCLTDAFEKVRASLRLKGGNELGLVLL